MDSVVRGFIVESQLRGQYASCILCSRDVKVLASEPIVHLAARFTPDVDAEPEQLKEEYDSGLSVVGHSGHEDTIGGRPFSTDGNRDGSSRQMLRDCSTFCGKCTQKHTTACMQTRLLHTCNACSTLTAALFWCVR